MANAGIKSTQAGTSLRTIMNNLTGEVKIYGKSIGDVTIANTNADGSMRSLTSILADWFRRIHLNNHGCKSIVWRCISRLEPTGQECQARTVNETVLENVVVQAINTLLGDKSTYQAQLQQNIAKVIRSAQQNTADDIDERLQELQDFIKQQPAHLEAFDESLVKRWLERIIVWDDHFTVELKSGLKIDIEG